MALKDSSKEYSDIINLPHHVSKKHPQMSMHDRAAQFSPFAALTGHGAAIRETARLTDEKMELDEKLLLLMEHLKERPIVVITYFKKDERKSGGSYEMVEGVIRKIDFYERVVVMEDRMRIKIEDIIDMESDVFAFLQ